MSRTPDRPANRLKDATSPYLQQHAHNPVDWYPWGPEALAAAREQGKPILLSVGYAACHWCHVMERESFEDEATAADMNAHFINVKVDREERPDLDEIYMSAVQAFTGGHGGWPMTVFLTPDGHPYFGGTYFPPVPRQGMPAFRQVLAHCRDQWVNRRAEVAETTLEMRRYLEQRGQLPGARQVEGDWLAAVAEAADAEFDETHGGFGSAPKFPPHGMLSVLLAHHHRTGDARSLQLVTDTLAGMAKGGMWDLAGGGFCRYSVDETWRVPHFEKMLYDNAQLAPVYLACGLTTGDASMLRVARETCSFVLRELGLPGGGFASALDADSDNLEGAPEEGFFYTWTPRELREVLGLLDGMRVATLLEVTDEGTFEHGRSVLRLASPLETLPEEDRVLLESALPRLEEARRARPAPGRDDKVITAWNALMASALARTGAALQQDALVDAAEACVGFLLDSLVRDGRLLRTWRNGAAHTLAYADDYAALVNACIDLYEVTGSLYWLDEAQGLANELVRLFWDTAAGGLFYTGHDGEALVSRSKRMLSGAEPSANGLAAWAFARLATLCGRDDLGGYADDILSRYQLLVGEAPQALGFEALASAWRQGPVQELAVLVGEDGAGGLLEAVWRQHLPFTALAPVASEEHTDAVKRLPWLAGKTAAAGRATAYLCEGFACKEPVQEAGALTAQLAAARGRTHRPVGFGRDRAPALPTDPAHWLNCRQPLSLDRLQGHIVVLDFWTHCCINCQHVLPELEALEQRFSGRPVAVVGVHSAKFPAEKERESVARAIARHGIAHPVVNDPDHTLWEQYAVKGWPTVMVLDSAGRIAWRQSGEVDRKTLGAVVERLLREAETAGTLAADPLQTDARPAGHASPLSFPGKVAVYPPTSAQEQGGNPFDDGRLYVSDSGHNRILEARLSLGGDGWPQAELLRAFGTGEAGRADGEGVEVSFHHPQGLDRTGDVLFVADTGNHALRGIHLPSGRVRTLAGTGKLGRGGEPGAPLDTALRSPWDVAAAGPESGAARPGQEVVFVAMAGTHQLWVYMPAADRLSPFVGSGIENHIDGAPGEAALAQPSGLELYGRYLFFADAEVSSVRFLDLEQRQVGTLVGKGLFDFGDVDGLGEAVRLQHPLCVAVADGRVWVADTYNHKLKAISLRGGETETVVGPEGELCEPSGLARAGGYLIVADTGNHRLRVVRARDGAVRDLPVLGLGAP